MMLLDTNVLIYAFDSGSPMHPWGRSILRDAVLGDGAAINPVILAELSAGDQSPDTLVQRLEALGVNLLDLPVATALRCARAYSDYLANRGKQSDLPAAPKSPLPDFFVGAHASALDLTLATADTGRYQTYFPEVHLLTPS
ncbi:MAG: type II toxin-antitoxin system VapC family toxin [Opitutales bacterium]